jgi:hypothetical protein
MESPSQPIAYPQHRTDFEVMGIAEVAHRASLSVATLRRLIAHGEIEIVRLSPRRIGITWKSYLDFVARRSRAAA